MTNIENEMSGKSEAVTGLCKGLATICFIGSVQLADVQAFFAILSYIAGGLYAGFNAYVLWRDKIRSRK